MDMATPNLRIIETIAIRYVEQMNTHQKWASHYGITKGFKIFGESHWQNI